ncbi:hypothetical protein AB0M39_14040 [Streptomyces sp. NPDC051907]|uniref:hypothetical protein n=1 Tax=Streptomyces sp. NPDC051907 TaxID=3155284 RepID=UPI0034450C63
MRRSTRATAIAAGTAAVAILTATALTVSDQASQNQPRKPGIILAHGADRHPAQTATDWVTYADHVVEVTPVADRDIPPGQDEIDRGEGLILRNVTLRVDKVLWSSDTSAKTAPSSFEWTAHGWQFTDGSTANRTEMAGEDEPRIETGHRYVMAIEWQEPKCDPGDGEIPGQWRGLGSESNIPYDNSVLGQGEFQGQIQASRTARAAAVGPEDPNYSLRDEFTGRTAEELTKRLNSTVPGQQEQPAAAPNKHTRNCG